MGAINYGHNNYINIGMNLKQFDNILKQKKISKNIQLIEHTEKEHKQIDNIMHFTFTHRNTCGIIKNN